MGGQITRLLQQSNGDNEIENKASPARLMGVKQNKKQSHRFITHDQAGSMWLP
jgi:hypothetical protein